MINKNFNLPPVRGLTFLSASSVKRQAASGKRQVASVKSHASRGYQKVQNSFLTYRAKLCRNIDERKNLTLKLIYVMIYCNKQRAFTGDQDEINRPAKRKIKIEQE